MPEDYCAKQTYPGSMEEPPEYCENEAVEGSEFCPRHGGIEPDPDAARDARNEGL